MALNYLGGREIELYCETCEEAICWKCIKKKSRHHSHNYDEIADAFEKCKKEISLSLEPMEKQLTAIEEVLTQFDARYKEISHQRAYIEADIDKSIGQIHKALDIRKSELITQLDLLTRTKLKTLAAQRHQIEIIYTRSKSSLDLIKKNLQEHDRGEVLLMKGAVAKQVKEISAALDPDNLKPNTEADMMFSRLKHIIEDCRTFGQVVAVGPLDPSKSRAKGEALKLARLWEESTVVLQTISFKNQPYRATLNSIECELVSDTAGTKVKGRIERRGQTQFDIHYTPTIEGNHQLHIKVEGQHIRGSPFPVTVQSPVEIVRTSILTIDGLKGPSGVAVNQQGEVVVTEWSGHCLSTFKPNGEKVRSFCTCGSHQDLQSPCGVAVDGNGCILVADYSRHQIKKFTAQGKLLAAVGEEGNGPLQFYYPRGIAVNTTNGRVYVGNDNNSIQILNSDLTHYKTFGRSGSGQGEFDTPWHLACDSKGNVYVADSDNHRIQVFTKEGEFLRMFGKYGKDKGELDCPYGIATDHCGRVYVSEHRNHRVSIFTLLGQFITSFAFEEKGANISFEMAVENPGSFNFPHGLTVDTNGVVYVCSYNNNSVQLYQPQL